MRGMPGMGQLMGMSLQMDQREQAAEEAKALQELALQRQKLFGDQSLRSRALGLQERMGMMPYQKMTAAQAAQNQLSQQKFEQQSDMDKQRMGLARDQLGLSEKELKLKEVLGLKPYDEMTAAEKEAAAQRSRGIDLEESKLKQNQEQFDRPYEKMTKAEQARVDALREQHEMDTITKLIEFDESLGNGRMGVIPQQLVDNLQRGLADRLGIELPEAVAPQQKAKQDLLDAEVADTVAAEPPKTLADAVQVNRDTGATIAEQVARGERTEEEGLAAAQRSDAAEGSVGGTVEAFKKALAKSRKKTKRDRDIKGAQKGYRSVDHEDIGAFTGTYAF